MLGHNDTRAMSREQKYIKHNHAVWRHFCKHTHRPLCLTAITLFCNPISLDCNNRSNLNGILLASPSKTNFMNMNSCCSI